MRNKVLRSGFSLAMLLLIVFGACLDSPEYKVSYMGCIVCIAYIALFLYADRKRGL